MPQLFKYVLIVSLLALISACAQNAPFRTGGIADKCYLEVEHCQTAIIEKHLEFDLAFVEFSERGNLFDRDKSSQVVDFVNDLANTEKGAAVFVFVHGWKHNASANDSNVREFREMLSRAAENPFVGERRVVGVYVGWRGKVTPVPLVRELSYWGRKSVAEEIGSGGATELLTELQHILVEQFADSQSATAPYKNTLVVIGHSFGGAIVLSALHDVILADLITAAKKRDRANTKLCEKIARFADGVILINPAIEANKVVLLKEAAARCTFGENQPQLMHVISSDADLATSRYFPIGQLANVTSTFSPKKLKRTINNKQVVLSERALDINTTGNLKQLRTGYLYRDKKANKWTYKSCRKSLKECGINSKLGQDNHITVNEYDPISFIKTDSTFIKNHNDVFSCYAQSYVTTIMFETQATVRRYVDSNYEHQAEEYQLELSLPVEDPSNSNQFANCDYRNFDFSKCFNDQLYEHNCELLN